MVQKSIQISQISVVYIMDFPFRQGQHTFIFYQITSNSSLLQSVKFYTRSYLYVNRKIQHSKEISLKNQGISPYLLQCDSVRIKKYVCILVFDLRFFCSAFPQWRNPCYRFGGCYLCSHSLLSPGPWLWLPSQGFDLMPRSFLLSCQSGFPKLDARLHH